MQVKQFVGASKKDVCAICSICTWLLVFSVPLSLLKTQKAKTQILLNNIFVDVRGFGSSCQSILIHYPWKQLLLSLYKM